jgi:putative ubiquitin-RnfH superfamily antitoxin RatB of RatAB toxin-antitoxin module
MTDAIHIEIVYAEPQRQITRKVEIAANSTVAEAIRASAIRAELPPGFEPAGIAIFGNTATLEQRLRDGDRIELLRPLLADPKESRRTRARANSKSKS